MASAGERLAAAAGAAAGVRADGRGRGAARALRVAAGALPGCDGSAHAALGATSAVCGIKADLCRPRASAPDCGSVHVTVELSPCAREQLGRPAAREREAEALAAALQAAFGGASDGSSAAVDLSRLCVVRAKHAWELGVHVALMSCGGGELVAAAAAVRAALSTAAIPRATQVATEGLNDAAEPDVEIPDGEEMEPLELAEMPIVLTAALLDGGAPAGEGGDRVTAVVVDPTTAEEAAARATLSAAVLPGGRVCWERLAHGGDAAVAPDEYRALRLAVANAAPPLADALDAQLAAEEASEAEAAG